MLQFMIVTLFALSVACSGSTVASSSRIKNGNWGHITFMVNPNKCFSTHYSTRYKFSQLYTAQCHPDITFETDQIDWRYDPSTHQLQNKGLSKKFGTPHCLALEAFSRNAKLYVVPCKGNNHFKFLIREEFSGSALQFVAEADQRYCVEFYGNYARHATYMTWGHLYDCQSWSTNSEQWTNFYFRSAYTGPALVPVQDPNLSSGNWGSLKLRTNGLCVAVEAVHLKVEVRHCMDTDEASKFRYVPNTGELQNWRYPETSGGKGCVTRSGNSQLYVTRCTGSPEQKFIIKNGMLFTGVYQQIQLFTDQRYCLHVYGSKRLHPYRCHTTMTASSAQFFQFLFWRSSVHCPAGKIPFGNSDTCKDCPAGTFSPSAGAMTCQTCPAGKTSTAGSTSCHFANTCPAGTYMNTNTGVCHHCPQNTFTNTAGSTSCTPCPDGTHTPGTGSTNCTPNQRCPAGTFINGAAGCTHCPINTYSDRINAETCTSCPDGFFTTTTGSTSCTRRTHCGPGMFHNGRHCQKCPKNTYDNTVGNTECTPCPHGQETKTTGATRCTKKNNCQAGSFWSDTANSCTPCPKNTYTDRPHQVVCRNCPQGKGTRTTGSTECVKLTYCRPGKFHNGKNCAKCPVNTYTDEVGSTECKNCADGYETKTTGSTFCTKKSDITVTATAAASTLRCKRGQARPACLLKCRFRTNTGITIRDRAKVSFYKLVGNKWQGIGPIGYNGKADWFNVKVADRPLSSDAGSYKCEARYGQATDLARIRVVVG